MKAATLLVGCVITAACHRHDERPAGQVGSAAIDGVGSAAIDPAEAYARAAFPKGSPVGIPDNPDGLVVVNHERVDLEGLGSQRARAVLVDAWGPPTVDLESDGGHRTKGWRSASGKCVRLDGNRVELVDCNPPGSDALPDDSDVYAAEEARVRAAFPIHAPLAVPADAHGLTVRSDGAVVLPAMPSRQLFLALEDAFGSPDGEEWAEGVHHVTIDVASTDHRCWALLWFVECGERDAMLSDARWGHGP